MIGQGTSFNDWGHSYITMEWACDINDEAEVIMTIAGVEKQSGWRHGGQARHVAHE